MCLKQIKFFFWQRHSFKIFLSKKSWFLLPFVISQVILLRSSAQFFGTREFPTGTESSQKDFKR